MRLSVWMEKNGACEEAMEWVDERTPKQAWEDCERGDWMLWALGRTSIDKREIVRIACDIALSVLPLSDDPRVAAAIDAAEGWCEGTVTAEQCREAASGARTAYAAAYAADAAAYAADAADAAAYAADAAAYAAAYAADAAAYAADAAAYAAYAADAAYAAYAADAAYAWRQAREDSLREIADLIRSRVSAAQFSKLVTQLASPKSRMTRGQT